MEATVTYEELHPGGETADLLCVCCNVCGYRLSRSGDGTNSEQECPQCGAELAVIVNEHTTHVKVLKGPKRPSAAKKRQTIKQ